MDLIVLGERDVHELLPIAECINVMDGAFRTVARGGFMQPLRSIAWQPDGRGAIGTMPGFLADPDAVGAKVITVFPQNRALGLESHQGSVLLHETATGKPLAIVHAGAVTAIRTAAVSALATRILAEESASRLALLGSGTQARSHLEAMLAVRPIKHVKIWSRTAANARAFAETAGAEFKVEIEVTASAREAVRGAQIVCTVTAATAPVLEGAWLEPGMHVNAAGSSVPPFRELDAAVVERSRIFVDNRECVLNEADDLRIPIAEGAIGVDRILGDLGELAAGTVPGRISSSDITLFKSVGMAIEDIAAARELHRRAVREGRGTRVDY
ncbi:MAG TPA: ornithine cyclodeaminase family protein [Candidatus Rubrimentiphilum sp.]|nr:ornithine cyclodeaminase family protein [Candidatus Rubrimentiphilum sp.]